MPIAIAAMAAGTLLSTYGQFAGAAAQRRQVRAQQAQSDMEAQNQRLEQVRQSRIARANSVQMAENQGAGGSSSETQAAQNYGNQAASNIGFINQESDIGHTIASAKIAQVNAQGLVDLGQGITKLGALGAKYG